MLKERVSIVFHSAASVRFTDPLKPTLETNLRGTAEMVNLGREIVNLKSFVYVSTAYAHCNRSDIDEVVYEAPMKPEQLLNCLDWMSEEQMEAMAPQ
jgi:thioester reductase-like protein